jgi:hypothetical protein
MNRDWLFHPSVVTGDTEEAFDDRSFTRVVLPHTNKMLPWHGFDDAELRADGADTTRIVLRVTDQFGRIRPTANDPIVFELTGPAQLIGDNPFSLVGGTGAVWIRARQQSGVAVLRAKHPRLGTQELGVNIKTAEPELV